LAQERVIPYLGRIVASSPTRPSFDPEALLDEVCSWLGDDIGALAETAKRLRKIADEWRKEGEELSGPDYDITVDPVWMAGLHLGQAEVLEALARQLGGHGRSGPEIDLVIIDHRHEVWIDLPDAPAQRLLEDKRKQHREKMLRALEAAPPEEPHVAVFDPAGEPIRYVHVGADGDCFRTLQAAMEWVETFVKTGAQPAGDYVFKRPGAKVPVRQRFPRGV
jgi:hypothetical protein